MSYQEEQLSKIANSIRVMQGGTTDNFSATDFANQIRNIDRDSLPYKSTIALEDNYVVVEDSLDDEVDTLTIYGHSEQDGTPTPDEPVEILNVGGEMRIYGRNIAYETYGWRSNNTKSYPISVETVTEDGVTFERIQREQGLVGNRLSMYNAIFVEYPDDFAGQICGASVLVRANRTVMTSPTPGYNQTVHEITTEWTALNAGISQVADTGRINGQITIADDDIYSLVVDIQPIQLELGSTATTYQPYVEPTTITIPTLYGIGDVKDVLHVDRASERAWVERNCGAKTYHGDVDEYWGTYNSVGDGAFGAYINEPLVSTNSRKNGFSNLFIPQNSPTNQTNEGITFGAGNQSLYVIISQNTVNSVDAWREFLSEQNMHVVFLLETPTIEELDYTALPTHFGGTTIMFTPSDDSPSPVVSEVTLRTITDHTNEDIVSMALTSMGVTPSGDTDTDLASLDTLGVDPYSVTSYDTSETYANEVQALGVQPTNNATDNIEILNELGVSVYE